MHACVYVTKNCFDQVAIRIWKADYHLQCMAIKTHINNYCICVILNCCSSYSHSYDATISYVYSITIYVHEGIK